MKKVVLYYPKTDHEKNYMYYWIPYSLLTIASGCIGNYDVQCLDANADDDLIFCNNLTRELENTLCVGISCMTGHQIKNGIEFAKKIRKTNSTIPIIWGGPHPTLFPEQTLKSEFVDYVIQGQGEVRLPLLLDAINKGKSKPYNIEGVGEKYKGQLLVKKGHCVYDKSTFPDFPWHLINLNKYIKCDKDINFRTLNYLTSQGCPFHCGFCSEVALYGGHWTSFNTDRVIKDINYLVTKYSINGIKFYDANFFGRKSHALDIAEQLIPLNIRWAASGHPTTLSTLTNEEWHLLKKSGCNRLLIGLESGSQPVLDSIHKGFIKEKALPLSKKLAEFDIIGSFTFIVGFPDKVDDKEVEKTLELAQQIRCISKKHECKIHFYAPYPGTPLWNKALERGFVEPENLEEWSEFDYYTIETPWMPQALERDINLFNKENCPYVHL